jgi:hypothetical protein
MNEPANLDTRLAALRDASLAWEPPASVDAAVAAAANRQRTTGPQTATRLSDRRSLLWPLALAAAMGVLSFIVRSLPPTDDPMATHGDAAAQRAAAESARHAFTPVVSAAELRNVGEAVVVPTRVPLLTLAQFGLPVDPARVDDAVDAELLVRRDGALLAYRFVN